MELTTTRSININRTTLLEGKNRAIKNMNEIQNLNYCHRAIKLKEKIEIGFLSLGEMLLKIKEENLFQPNWATFGEFLMELRMSENMARKLIQIYRTFILDYNFTIEEVSTVGGWSALQEILPIIKNKKDAEKWLEQARELTTTDLRRSVREEKTGIDMASCKHKDTYTVTICKDCGDRWTEHDT